MKNTLSLLVCFILATTSFAQEANFLWGTPEKASGKSMSPEVIGTKDNKAYILRSANPKPVKGYYLTVHDINTAEQEGKIIFDKLLPKDVADNFLHGVYLLNDKIVILSTAKKKELVGSILSLDGKVQKGRVIIDNVDSKDREFDEFNIELSPNLSTILGYRKTKGTDKKSTYFVFATFDENLKRVNTAKFQLPYDEKNIELEKVSIDDNSNLYVVANITVEGKRKKFDIIKSVLMHASLSDAKPELKEVVLPLENRLPTSVSFIMFQNSIAVSGMYAASTDADFLEGVFYAEINKANLEVTKFSLSKFKAGLKTRKMGFGSIASGGFDNNVSFGYKLKELMFEDDGKKLMLFEHSKIYYYTDQKGNEKLQTYRLDIIAVRLDGAGQIEWNSMIYKNQFITIPTAVAVGVGISVNVYRSYKRFEDMLGFTTLYKGNNVYLVFNDHVENQKNKFADKGFNNINKSYTAIVKLNLSNGEWDKSSYTRNKKDKHVLSPNNSIQIGANKVLVFSFDVKQNKTGIMTID